MGDWYLCSAVLALLPIVQAPASASSAAIDDFRSVQAWSENQDGGRIEISAGSVKAPNGSSCMRLVFPSGAVQWGNAVRRISLPPNAVGVEFDVYVSDAEPPTGLFVWLMEADGDGHLVNISPGGKRLHEAKGSWQHCFAPITAFTYDPRGNKTKELLTVDRMLIGMNVGKGDICVANLAFRVVDRAAGMEGARTPGLQIRNGPRGRVAILRDGFEPAPGNADPDTLADALSGSGYGVTFLRAGDLSDGAVLTRDNFDCLILPYGPSYPSTASESIKMYLKSGGSFLSMGGYAFDRPCAPGESGKLVPMEAVTTAGDVASGRAGANRMNTRSGTYGDALTLDPSQIGVFDPCYHLSNAVGGRSAEVQSVVPGSLSIKGELQGYAACSLLGSNSPVFPEKWGRHIPLVQAVDAHGRYRGDVGSLAMNYAGPYAGSSWGFFGVTNRDLFAKDGPMLAHLPPIMDSLLRKTFLHSLSTDLASYRSGETIKVSCKVANLGRGDVEGKVILRVIDAGGHARAISETPVSVKAGATSAVEAADTPASFASDFYRVTADLVIGGRAVDSMETGFVVQNPRAMSKGFRLGLKGNYFREGNRPVFISGTNHTGAIFYSGNENPLVWERDLARMQENGLSTLRILHFSPFLSEKPAANAVRPIDLKVDRLPIRTERQLDALVQLCQKHKIVLFLSIHDWMSQDLSDEELAAQKHYARLIAERYKDVPGFMIDIQNEPYITYRREANPNEMPYVVRDWNAYLQAKYGSDEALRAAWHVSPPESPLGSVPYRMGTDAWNDVRTLDAEEFRTIMLNKWIDANRDGAKEADPDRLVTVGFLQEYWGADKILCMDKLDLANMHTYMPIDNIRADLKLFDRRFEGKSVSIGEFGSLVDHDKRNHGLDGPDKYRNWFLLVGHYLFGLGGSFMENWDWKEMDDCVFPWGINYSCNGPRKTTLEAYRNQSLLFRAVRPVYKSPSVFLVIPTDQMMGGKGTTAIGMLYKWVDALYAAHADFGVIDDRHLAQLPSSARMLVYPFPFSIPDDAYASLKPFVEKGGTLCITGDVSFDRLRRQTNTGRLEELCGVQFVSRNYPDITREGKVTPCIQVRPSSAKLTDGVYLHSLGKGRVYYTPDPNSYAVFDAPLASLGGSAIVPSTATHAYRIPEVGGGCTYILVNPGKFAQKASVQHPGAAAVELSLGTEGVGLVRFDKAGKLLAVESQGSVKVGGKTILSGRGHFAVMSCDGQDLASSQEMIALPFGGGKVDLVSKSRTKDLVIQTGDVVGGKWQVLSESNAGEITAEGPTAFDIRIIAPKDRLPALARFVVSELMLY